MTTTRKTNIAHVPTITPTMISMPKVNLNPLSASPPTAASEVTVLSVVVVVVVPACSCVFVLVVVSSV